MSGYGHTKAAVLELLEASGPGGASVGDLMRLARARGFELNAGSVSSTLSRLARDGAIGYAPPRPERYFVDPR